MAKLTEAIKTYIVQGLATYRTPTEISESVKEEFGIDVPRSQVAGYDPEGHAAGEIAQKWKDLHAATRKAFNERSAELFVAQKSFRLRELGDNYRRLKRMGNFSGANSVLEQAAKEVGDVFTNRTKVDANVSVHEAWLAKLPPPPT